MPQRNNRHFVVLATGAADAVEGLLSPNRQVASGNHNSGRHLDPKMQNSISGMATPSGLSATRRKRRAARALYEWRVIRPEPCR